MATKDTSTQAPKGGASTAMAGKVVRKPAAGFGKPKGTMPSTLGFKAGGMVRRGFGAARGA